MKNTLEDDFIKFTPYTTETCYVIRRKDGEVTLEDCPTCRGSGSIDCKKCNGDGQIECGDCCGDGNCKHCGDGVCPECEGKGHLECFNCKGNGAMECKDCEEGKRIKYLKEIPKGEEEYYEKIWTYPNVRAEKQKPLEIQER